MNAIARTKVADLARDPKLLERLAAELAKWAARWWGAALDSQYAAIAAKEQGLVESTYAVAIPGCALR